jgi:hypothetical protein
MHFQSPADPAGLFFVWLSVWTWRLIGGPTHRIAAVLRMR